MLFRLNRQFVGVAYGEAAYEAAASPCYQQFLFVVHCQLSEAVVDGVAGALKAILFVWGLFVGRNLADD